MDVREKPSNKMRLIDANALDERFDKRVEWLRLDAHDKYFLGLYHGAATDKDLIGEMPTVDAVEVVRCKDCKHRHSDSWCEYVDDDDNFYCARGERKEGAD